MPLDRDWSTDRSASLADLEHAEPFVERHVGPSTDDQAKMLALLGSSSLDDLVEQTLPPAIRSSKPLALDRARSEAEVLSELRVLAARNRVLVPMIGLGYYGTTTPPVVQRNVLEDPAWYTAYTPYQPEISQGRLEALINFQTMIADLTGLDVAGASMLDESTAAAEAMTLVRRAGRAKPDAVFVVDVRGRPARAIVTKLPFVSR